jgi:hypothetical protein
VSVAYQGSVLLKNATPLQVNRKNLIKGRFQTEAYNSGKNKRPDLLTG